ncbi:MAG: hypothetical protein Q7S27_04370 [Nanoarchaeota archaeon]|nr:hypothetical protein [Nanoarchaeota archaeon]
MNRKGQLIGKAITTLPVLLSVIFISGVFLILVGFAILIEKPKVPNLLEGFETNDFIFTELNIQSERHLLVEGFVKERLMAVEFERLYSRAKSGSLTTEEKTRYDELNIIYNSFFNNIREGIKKELEEKAEGSCFLVFFDEGRPIQERVKLGSRDIYYSFKAGKIEDGRAYDFNLYYDKNKFVLVKFPVKTNNEKRYIVFQYYYGKCLEGGK